MRERSFRAGQADAGRVGSAAWVRPSGGLVSTPLFPSSVTTHKILDSVSLHEYGERTAQPVRCKRHAARFNYFHFYIY